MTRHSITCDRYSSCRRLPARARGLAISVILLAIVLLAALGVAMSLSSRALNGTASEQAPHIDASVILREATTIHDAVSAMHATGCPTSWIGFTTANGACNVEDPASGEMEPQVPPNDAFVSATNAQWIEKVDTGGNAVVKLMNVGVSANADYVMVLFGLKQSVCQQLNQLLLGTTTIPAPAAGSGAAWSTAATAIDLSADSAVNGILAQCVSSTDGSYVFYSVLRAM